MQTSTLRPAIVDRRLWPSFCLLPFWILNSGFWIPLLRGTSRSTLRPLVVALALLLAAPLHAQEAPPPSPAPEAAAPDEAISQNPYDMLFKMGWFVYPLLLASVIAVWFAIERAVVLRRGRVIPKPFVQRFFQHLEQGMLDQKGALRLCDENGSPVADIFAHGLRKWGKPSVEVEQAIIDGGERQISQLRKHLRVLNGVATVAPLIGLLGTVVGMIQAFNLIAGGTAMGKAEELAGGIGLALLTTAAGLLIAIPALIMYMYLAGRVDALVIEMDRLAQRLVDLISAESLSDQSRRVPRPAAVAAKAKAV